MDIVDDAPMTFGQLSTWRSLNTLPRSRWAEGQLRDVWPLPAGVSAGRLADCWDAMVRRHESLRTQIVFDDVAVPRQVIYGDVQPMEFVRAGAGEARDLSACINQAEADRVMALDQEFGWRVTGVVGETGDIGYLSVVVHHVIADRTAFWLLRSELESLLAHPESASDPAPLPRDLARLQRSNESRQMASAEFVIRQLLEAGAGRDGVPEESYRIMGGLESAPAARALRQISVKYGISAHSMLLALTAIALNCFWRRENPSLMLMAGNRGDLRWRNLISSMNQGLPVQMSITSLDDDLPRFAAELRANELRTYRHGMYDVDVVESALTPRGVSLYAYDSCFNFLSSDFDSAADEEGDADTGPAEVEVATAIRRTGPRFDLKVRGSSALQLGLRVDPALLPEDRLVGMLRWYEDEMLRLAVGDLDSVREVLRRCTGGTV